MQIAVLALQGAFIEHEKMLSRLGVQSFEVRNLHDWSRPKDGLIIPGGESTTMLRLLRDLELLDPIRRAISEGLPVFGTCAGMILLAQHVEGDDIQRVGTMQMTARRNAYGRQLGSFHTVAPCLMTDGRSQDIPMTFIRAPFITEVGEGVEVLARVDDQIVAVRQGRQLATAFHPELDADTSFHAMWLDMIQSR